MCEVPMKRVARSDWHSVRQSHVLAESYLVIERCVCACVCLHSKHDTHNLKERKKNPSNKETGNKRKKKDTASRKKGEVFEGVTA